MPQLPITNPSTNQNEFGLLEIQRCEGFHLKESPLKFNNNELCLNQDEKSEELQRQSTSSKSFVLEELDPKFMGSKDVNHLNNGRRDSLLNEGNGEEFIQKRISTELFPLNIESASQGFNPQVSMRLFKIFMF